MNLHDLSWLNSPTIAGVAQKLQREIPNGIILDQYRNVRSAISLMVQSVDLSCCPQKGKQSPGS
jgi:hypothetical protein